MHEELMAALKNLGFLRDAKDMIQEMDLGEFDCPPELRLLPCGTHLERRPEKELRPLFQIIPSNLVASVIGWNLF